MKRLIAKNNYPKSAYIWVKERAEHLMDTADMNEPMAYGIAWKQWKKKYKKNKKSANKNIENDIYENVKRLIKKAVYVHCHNCGWDNGDFIKNDDDTFKIWVENKREKTIKKMLDEQLYHSFKEYKHKNANGICPICGKKDLDID